MASLTTQTTRTLPSGIASEAALFVEFRNRYLDLVELVCDAAQGGVDPEMAASYVLHTGWFREQWSAVGAWFLPWVGVATSEDPVAALFMPPSLSELLAGDGGRLIHVLEAGQTAMELWEAELRRQEALV